MSTTACNEDSLGIQDGDSSAFKDAVIINESDITGVEISVTNPIIAVGDKQAFTASGLTNTVNTDITADVTWGVSDTAIASINESGVLTGKVQGDVTVTASIASLTASSEFRVTAAAIEAIDITSTNTNPADLSVTVCKALQLTAMARYTGETLEQNVTDLVTWSALTTTDTPLAESVAHFSNESTEKGLLLTTSEISAATITAQRGTFTSAATGNLNIIGDAGLSITITPLNVTKTAFSATEAFTAEALYTDSSVEPVTRTVFWASDNAAIATISNAQGSEGIATTKSNGDALITASCNNTTPGEATLTIEVPTTLLAVNITIDPDYTSVPASSESQLFLKTDTLPVQLSADAFYNVGPKGDVTSSAEWLVNFSGAGIQPVNFIDTDPNGLLTVAGPGTANIEITYTPEGENESKTDIIIVTVEAP